MPFTKKTAMEAGKKSTRKNVPNKSTEGVRNLFLGIVEKNVPKIQEDLDALEPEQRLKMLLELSKFVLPVLKSTELKGDIGISSRTMSREERDARIEELIKKRESKN